MANEVNVVIGSWGSYNECNERALGSKWLCFNDFDSWEEIEEELTKEGFELKGIDEELFIQDYEGFDGGFNCDSMHPKTLFTILHDSGVLEDEEKFKKMVAYLEVRCWTDFVTRVEEDGEDWDNEIYIYEGYSVADYGEEKWNSYGYSYNLPDYVTRYIDYEQFGQDDIDNGYAEEYSNGIIEIVD